MLDCAVPALTPHLENEVENLWQAKQKKRGHALFNDHIMPAVGVAHNRIHACIVEYRHLLAQRPRPELFDTLKVRPVAVSGLFECAKGIAFSRRAGTMTQGAGLWELVPSGGINTRKMSDTTEVDYLAQILTKLHEETGINANYVSSVRPFCLVHDADSHVIDIGVALISPLGSNEGLKLH